MSYDRFAQWEAIRVKDTSSDNITGTAENFGSVLLYNADSIAILNNSDADLYFSLDGGTTFGIVALANGGSFADNLYEKRKVLEKGTQIQVKTVSGTASSGNVYIMVSYAN